MNSNSLCLIILIRFIISVSWKFSHSREICEKLCFAFQDFAPRVVVMYVIALLAFLFYISKVPERYFPGRYMFLEWIYDFSLNGGGIYVRVSKQIFFSNITDYRMAFLKCYLKFELSDGFHKLFLSLSQ